MRCTHLLFLGFLVLTAAPSTQAQSTPQISQIVIFGDSLSDTGNLYADTGIPSSPPYFDGRFSNGPLWIERLACVFEVDSAQVTNLAYGGATSQVVLEYQVLPYVSAAALSPDTLYVIWAGANDFLGGVVDPAAAIGEAVSNLASCVATLALSGARHILVVNLPNLARTPLVLASADPAFIEGSAALSVGFNQALDQTVDLLEAQLSLDVLELDSFSILEQIVASPRRFDLGNVTEPVLQADGSLVPDEGEYLFFDNIHPTRRGHALLAVAAIQDGACELLRGTVQELRAAGSLTPRRAAGLLRKLEHAEKAANELRFRAAARDLEVFARWLQNLVERGELPHSEAQPLQGLADQAARALERCQS